MHMFKEMLRLYFKTSEPKVIKEMTFDFYGLTLYRVLGIDVVIFQALLSISSFDLFLLLSIIMLVTSMPAAVSYILIRSLQNKCKIMEPKWKIISITADIAIFCCFLAILFYICHVALIAAIILFYSFSLLLCGLYLMP